jgi:hypothetical protein
MTVGKTVLDDFPDSVKTYRSGYRFIVPEAVIAYTIEVDWDKRSQERKKYLVGAESINGNNSDH